MLKRLGRGFHYWILCMNPFSRFLVASPRSFKAKFHAYKRDVVGRYIFKHGEHGPEISRLLLGGSIPSGGAYIDVGANIGYFSVLLSRLAGNGGIVHSFEPEPGNFALLKRNIDGNGCSNVKLYDCALGETEDVLSLGLYKASNRGRHSLLKNFGHGTVSVPVKRLDALVEGDAPIAFMKVDVEGFELPVLRGAERLLPQVQNLVIEFSPGLMAEAHLDVAELVALLEKHFPCCYRFNPPSGELEAIDFPCLLRQRDQMDIFLRK